MKSAGHSLKLLPVARAPSGGPACCPAQLARVTRTPGAALPSPPAPRPPSLSWTRGCGGHLPSPPSSALPLPPVPFSGSLRRPSGGAPAGGACCFALHGPTTRLWEGHVGQGCYKHRPQGQTTGASRSDHLPWNLSACGGDLSPSLAFSSLKGSCTFRQGHSEGWRRARAWLPTPLRLARAFLKRAAFNETATR